MSSDRRLEDIVQGKWPVQWSETPKVNRMYNNVLRISETHVVKLPNLSHFSSVHYWNLQYWKTESENDKLDYLINLNCEFQIQKTLFDSKVSVPKPEGIYEVTVRDSSSNSEASIPCLVMEFIPGVLLNDLFLLKSPFVYFKSHLQRRREIRKATKLGFVCYDSYKPSNAIWNPEKQKTYLIDFQHYVRRK